MKVSFGKSNIINLENPAANKKNDIGNQDAFLKKQEPRKPEFDFGRFYYGLIETSKAVKNKSNSILENYEFAEKYFDKNLNPNKPLLDKNSLNKLGIDLSNNKVRRNLVRFFAKKAEKELAKIENVDFANKEQLDKIKGLTQVRDFFNEFLELWPEEDSPKRIKNQSIHEPLKQVAFAGKLTRDDEKKCKRVVHGFAAACSATSALIGEGAAFGVEPWILRGIQGIMFLYMQNYLAVPPGASAIYMGKEMFSGCTLGVEGAKILNAWGAIAAEAMSGGTAAPPVTGGLRLANGSLSLLITEKMGRGYIKRVKNNQMTFNAQAMEAGAYFGGKMIFGGLDNILDVSISEAGNANSIKDALSEIPKETKSIYGEFLSLATNRLNLDKTAILFLTNFTPKVIFNNFGKNKGKYTTKEIAQQAFKQAFLTTAVYDICDLSLDAPITHEAQETMEKLQEKLEKYPDVFKKFVETEHEFFEKINIDELSDEEFTRQFKNKDFVFHLSKWIEESIDDFKIKAIEIENEAKAAQILAGMKKKKEINTQRAEQRAQISPDEKAEVQASMEKMKQDLKIQQDLLSHQNNFGYGRIAGYKKTKELLAEKFITKVGLEKSGYDIEVPPVILFYGPTGTGKSTLAKALPEQAKCRFDKFKTRGSEESVKSTFLKKIETAKEWQSKKRTVILIDEAEKLNKYLGVIDEMQRVIDSDENNFVTFILTSNNPTQINQNLLDASINIPVEPSSKEDLINIFNHYLKDKAQENCDFNLLADETLKSSKDNAYSNSQIEDICTSCYKKVGKENRLITTNDMLKLIQSSYPEITKADLQQLEQDKKSLPMED